MHKSITILFLFISQLLLAQDDNITFKISKEKAPKDSTITYNYKRQFMSAGLALYEGSGYDRIINPIFLSVSTPAYITNDQLLSVGLSGGRGKILESEGFVYGFLLRYEYTYQFPNPAWDLKPVAEMNMHFGTLEHNYFGTKIEHTILGVNGGFQLLRSFWRTKLLALYEWQIHAGRDNRGHFNLRLVHDFYKKFRSEGGD